MRVLQRIKALPALGIEPGTRGLRHSMLSTKIIAAPLVTTDNFKWCRGLENSTAMT